MRLFRYCLLKNRTILLVLACLVGLGISGCTVTHSRGVNRNQGLQAYVANLAGAAEPGNTVAVIDLATNKVERHIITGTEPSALAIAPKNGAVYVANRGSDTVSVINSSTNKVTSNIKVGLEPDAVSASPDGAYIVVANLDGNNLNIVNARTNKVTATISTPQEPDAVAITPDSRWVYAADFGANEVTAIEIAPNLTVASHISIPVGVEPDALAVSPLGTMVYVANFGSNSITSIPLADSNRGIPKCGPSSSPCRSISAGRDPTGIAFSSNGKTAYVVGGDSLTLVNVSRAFPFDTVPLGKTAEAIGLSPNGKVAYIADEQGYITPVSLSTNKPTKPIPVGGHPVAVAISPGH